MLREIADGQGHALVVVRVLDGPPRQRDQQRILVGADELTLGQEVLQIGEEPGLRGKGTQAAFRPLQEIDVSSPRSTIS